MHTGHTVQIRPTLGAHIRLYARRVCSWINQQIRAVQENCTLALQFKRLWYSCRHPEGYMQYAPISTMPSSTRVLSPRNILCASPNFPRWHKCPVHIIFPDLDHSSIQQKPIREMSWKLASSSLNMKFQHVIISNHQQTIPTDLQCYDSHTAPSVVHPHLQ